MFNLFHINMSFSGLLRHFQTWTLENIHLWRMQEEIVGVKHFHNNRKMSGTFRRVGACWVEQQETGHYVYILLNTAVRPYHQKLLNLIVFPSWHHCESYSHIFQEKVPNNWPRHLRSHMKPIQKMWCLKFSTRLKAAIEKPGVWGLNIATRGTKNSCKSRHIELCMCHSIYSTSYILGKKYAFFQAAYGENVGTGQRFRV